MTPTTTTGQHVLAVAASGGRCSRLARCLPSALRRAAGMPIAAIDRTRTEHGYVKPNLFGTWAHSRHLAGFVT